MYLDVFVLIYINLRYCMYLFRLCVFEKRFKAGIWVATDDCEAWSRYENLNDLDAEAYRYERCATNEDKQNL